MTRDYLRQVQNEIKAAWERGFYTEIHRHGKVTRRYRIASPDEADETHPGYVGIFDGRVCMDTLVEELTA